MARTQPPTQGARSGGFWGRRSWEPYPWSGRRRCFSRQPLEPGAAQGSSGGLPSHIASNGGKKRLSGELKACSGKPGVSGIVGRAGRAACECYNTWLDKAGRGGLGRAGPGCGTAGRRRSRFERPLKGGIESGSRSDATGRASAFWALQGSARSSKAKAATICRGFALISRSAAE